MEKFIKKLDSGYLVSYIEKNRGIRFFDDLPEDYGVVYTIAKILEDPEEEYPVGVIFKRVPYKIITSNLCVNPILEVKMDPPVYQVAYIEPGEGKETEEGWEVPEGFRMIRSLLFKFRGPHDVILHGLYFGKSSFL